MRSLLAALALSLLALPTMADAPTDSLNFRLDAHRWEHRLLLVFAPEADSARPDQEAQLDGSDAGFRDRDLLLLTITGPENGTVREAPGDDPRSLTEAAVRRLYDHFGVPTDAFRVVLVGKDGTEKRRDAEPVTARSLFDTIDAMPMRQRELQEKSETGGEE
jgi:hypothetical protein